MRNNTLFFLITAILSTVLIHTGCNKSSLAPSDYARYVTNKENGLMQKKEVKDKYCSTLYKPLDYVTLIEIPKGKINQSNFESTKKQFEGMYYFTFSIANKDGKKLTEENLHSDSLFDNKEFDYYNFQMQKDFFLVAGKDTSTCSLFHYEHNYGVSPENRFLLGFDMKKINLLEGFKLLYDGSFIGSGMIEFYYSKEVISKIPSLNI